MITNLKIQNMRCFRDFTLERAGRITLVSGENNVGKSTILEALYLLLTYNQPNQLIALNAIRGVQPAFFSPDVLWEPFFTGMDMKRTLTVAGETDSGEKRSVSWAKDERFTSLQKTGPGSQPSVAPFQAPPEGQTLVDAYPLKITITGKNLQAIAHCIPQGNALQIQWNESMLPRPDDVRVHYIGPRLFFAQGNTIAQLFSQAELRGNKELLVEVRKSDNGIEDISVIMTTNNSAALFARRRDNVRLPLTAMGDGINRLLSILCVMMANPGCVILIDEIENGFHYSFYIKLWQLIEEVSRKTGGQVFATTHSYECIQGAFYGLKEAPDSDALRYVRLGKHGDKIEPHLFSDGSLGLAIEKDLEVR